MCFTKEFRVIFFFFSLAFFIQKKYKMNGLAVINPIKIAVKPKKKRKKIELVNKFLGLSLPLIENRYLLVVDIIHR